MANNIICDYCGRGMEISESLDDWHIEEIDDFDNVVTYCCPNCSNQPDRFFDPEE